MKPQVAIVNSSSFGKIFPEHLEALAVFCDVARVEVPRSASEQALIDRLVPYDALILSVTPLLSRNVLHGLPRLKLLARHGIGIDSIDLAAAKERKICVTRIPGEYEQTAVAEHAVALLLSLLRHIPQSFLSPDKRIPPGEAWGKRSAFVGLELKGKRVGILGLGNTGSRIAQILSQGFGALVQGSDPNVSAEQAAAYGAHLVTPSELFSSSDIFILAATLTPQTRSMLGATALSLLKPGVFIVNTARGELVDEGALAQALHAGHVGGYAADVLAEEPPSPGNPLLVAPRVILTPHLGAYTKESLQKMGETVVQQVRAVLVDITTPVGLVI